MRDSRLRESSHMQGRRESLLLLILGLPLTPHEEACWLLLVQALIELTVGVRSSPAAVTLSTPGGAAA